MEIDPLVDTIVDGRYRIEAILGRGGMGRVYRAQHLGIGRAVAVKVLDPRGGLDATGRARFEREAMTTGRMRHPNCVGATDSGSLPDGRLYLVMELLDGVTLDDLLADVTRLPIARAVHILRHVLRGLAHAHGLGIVHRDLTPRNIVLVTQDGDRDFAKVCDFGLARMAGGGEADRVTQTGIVCGTPKYMSPEQGLGGVVDQRTDLYAASILLFEMITGRPPFVADEALRVVAMHATAEPPTIAEVAPDVMVPPALEKLIRRGLEKKAADRPSSAMEYFELLDRCVEMTPAVLLPAVKPPVPPPAPRRSRLRAAALVAPALLAAAIAMGVTRPASAIARAHLDMPEAPAASVAAEEPVVEMPAEAAPRTLPRGSLDDLRAMRAKRPRDPAVLHALGNAYARRGWNQAAIDAYADAVRADPDGAGPALAASIAAMLDSRASWRTAARLLKQIGAEAVEPVRRIAEHHREGSVRARARTLLGQLE